MLSRMMGGVAGGADITLDYLGADYTTDSSFFESGTFDPGVEHASRVIVLVMHWDDTNPRDVSSGPTFDGQQMTEQVINEHDNDGWWYRVAIYTLAYPTGTGNKSLTGNLTGPADNILLNVYSMYNSDGITAHDTTINGSSNQTYDLIVDVNVEAGGAIFAGGGSFDAPTNSGSEFTNLTEDDQQIDNDLQMHSASDPFIAAATPQSIVYLNYDTTMDQLYAACASFSKG